MGTAGMTLAVVIVDGRLFQQGMGRDKAGGLSGSGEDKDVEKGLLAGEGDSLSLCVVSAHNIPSAPLFALAHSRTV